MNSSWRHLKFHQDDQDRRSYFETHLNLPKIQQKIVTTKINSKLFCLHENLLITRPNTLSQKNTTAPFFQCFLFANCILGTRLVVVIVTSTRHFDVQQLVKESSPNFVWNPELCLNQRSRFIVRSKSIFLPNYLTFLNSSLRLQFVHNRRMFCSGPTRKSVLQSCFLASVYLDCRSVLSWFGIITL